MPTPQPHPEKPRRIAILSVQAGPHMLQRGIYRYARPHKPWTFRHGFPAIEEVHRARDWGADGIIAFISDSLLAQHLLSLRIPVVNTTRRFLSPKIPTVAPDDLAIVAHAVAHLHECGFQNFGYYGSPPDPISNLRLEAFEEQVAKLAAPAFIFDASLFGYSPEAPYSWAVSDARLAKWLHQLPKPVAVMAWNDAFAFRLASVAVAENIRIPEDLALIGVDNDLLTCEMGFPTLSSVCIPWEEIGYRAAAALDTLLTEPAASLPTLLVKPNGIAVRQSTDIRMIDDPVLAEALQLIKTDATRGLSVTSLVGRMNVSRRKLEQRFRNTLHRSPMEEIDRVRLDNAMKLLRDESLTIFQVALQCGFKNRRQLSELLLRNAGKTPSTYRKEIRTAPSHFPHPP